MPPDMLGSGCFKLLSQAPSFGLSPCCPRSALRVQHVTLTGWMLRCAPHLSWQDPQTIPVARHAVKIWLQSYSKLWDHLLLEQQWKWLGHILRLPRDGILRQTLLNLRPTSRAFGHRRSRTGPNNSGHRLALRWLRHQGVDPSLAHDRHAWNSLGLNWVLRFGIRPPAQHVNVFHTHPDASLPTDFRAIQGCFVDNKCLFCLFLLLTGGWLVSWIVLKGGDVCTLMPLRIFQDFAAC